MKFPLFIVFCVCFIIPETTFSQDLSAREIVRKAEENATGVNSSYSEMTINIVRPKWEREMKLKSWSKGSDFSIIYILSPAKDKGTVFLKRENEVWNWLPTINRTIKLPPSMMMQSWMGTDLTNDDIVREASVVDDYNHTILGEEIVDGKLCYKIKMIPKADAAVVWSQVLNYIDKENFIELKTEMFDEDLELVNTILAKEIKMMDDHLIATTLEVIPADKEDHKTIIHIDTIEFELGIEEEFFTIQKMKTIK